MRDCDGRGDPAAADDQSPQQLVEAAGAGDAATVRRLLAAGAAANGPAQGAPPRGWTPLHAAAASGAAGCIQILLEAGASARAMAPEDRASPAHVAARRGDAASLGALLAATGPGGPATWARDGAQQTVLHLAACSGSAECTRAALARARGQSAKGGGLEARDASGSTALQRAAAAGHAAAAALLLEAGARAAGVPAALLPPPRLGPRSRAPAQPLAARKVPQPAELIGELVEGLPAPRAEATGAQLRALARLRDFCCGERAHREAALAAGAAARLVALLCPGGPAGATKAVAAAAQTLRNLSHERSAADELVRAGAVEALARVVSSDAAGSECAWRAAAAICQIADWPEHRERVRASGAVAALAALAATGHGRLHVPRGLLEQGAGA
ncbi:unnamed protein product [Prorocentrum cordatum]|uniref:Uncharacterized protein n=1 Tax=Prorocentrum cordatum TaxID=2364126 RepID=A0ABN9S1Q6_9DINO|nr:unnamed protein product [Polarella glacialis]